MRAAGTSLHEREIHPYIGRFQSVYTPSLHHADRVVLKIDSCGSSMEQSVKYSI